MNDLANYDVYFNEELTRHFKLGRSALSSLLSQLNIGIGDKILLPSLICREVTQIIQKLGINIIYYNVDKQFRYGEFEQDSKIKALLVVNYFGYPCEIIKAKEYCLKNSIILIEDNAHGLLGFDSDGNLLGTRGDFGIFSYRKFFPLSQGAFYINNSNCVLTDKFNISNKTPNITFYIKWALYVFQNKTRLNILSYIRKYMPEKKEAIDNDNSISSIDIIRYFCFKKIDFAKEVRRRKLLYKSLEINATKYGALKIFSKLPDKAVPYCFPFYCDDEIILKIRELATKNGLKVYRWPDLPDEIIQNCPEFYQKIWIINLSA